MQNQDPAAPNAEDLLINVTEETQNEGAETAAQATDENTVEISAEEKLQQENAALNDKYLRLFAEFDNYKRRTQKERIELLQTAGKDVIISLLPVLDDFDRANKAMETATDVNSVKEGVNLVHSKLKGILAQKGLKEIESIDTAFDTDNHEAITKIPAPNEEMKGKVIDELEKGYTLNDKVIRFAKVVVGS
ncbi:MULTISPECIES: nucleotide exchange factor GrpE [Pedobacter]|nr:MULTISPECIES: nucleotide exchange factor GrpE [Pedobacter]MBB5439446.1 molecular chaperone GrpE [Pedobacter sp. AK017]